MAQEDNWNVNSLLSTYINWNICNICCELWEAALEVSISWNDFNGFQILAESNPFTSTKDGNFPNQFDD